jgi:integrase
MPAMSITDAFVRDLTWAKALNALEQDRKKKHLERTIKPPVQVSFIDTLERGVALELVVGTTGLRTWRVITYRNGKAQSKKLGAYPAMKLKEAREAAKDYWKNPAKYDAQAQTGSFAEIAEKWVRRHVEGNKLRSGAEIKRILAQYVYPKWKDTPFLEIRRRQVNDLLDHIADKNGRVQADAVLTVIRGIMTWFQSRDEDYTSPIVRGMKRNTNNKARDRILDDDEIRALWAAADECGAFGAMMKQYLLTAQRREKVATMKRDDVKDGVWTIASEEREKGNAGKLALPQMAIDLIEAQPRFENNPYIFPASQRGRRPGSRGPIHFTNWSMSKQELDAKLNFERPWTIHDLRRTARSLMSRAGVTSEVAERVLGHVIGGVEGIYNRHQYFEEKADALSKLAALIERIINPSDQTNVIPLRA